VVMLTDNNIYSFLQQSYTTLVVLLVLAVTCLMLLGAKKIQDIIGETGIIVISKVMGLIIASFAIQNILSGIKSYFSL